jgi:hypothetical protein
VSAHPVDPDALEPEPIPRRSAGRPPSPPPLAKLAAKLVRVMGAIGHIPKRGRNDFFGYDYATEADVADAVRTALVAEGVAMIPSVADVREREVLTRKNQKEIVTTVTLDVTCIDADSGQTFTFQMAGAGQDAGDKGIMKAVTAAMKYAQLKALCLPTGDDPEADDAPDRAQAQPAPAARAPAREPGSDDVAAPYPLRDSRASAVLRDAPRMTDVRQMNVGPGGPAPAAPQPTPPWEEAPWPDDAQPAAPAPGPRREPPRARERPAPAVPARDPNRPRPDDCISDGKRKRLEALISEKARDYGWVPSQLRDYVHRHLAEQYGLEHIPDIPWRGSTYQELCEWVEALGAP